jgi:hypothetical protein
VSAVINGGATVNGGSGGASLPDTPAGVLLDAGNPLKLVYLDAGGVGDAVTFEDATDTGMSEIMTALAGGNATEGDFLVADGAGGLQLASTDTAAVRTVIGAIGTTTTTLYASDGTAANGAGVDATASVSGTGSGSTLTMVVGNTSRLLTGSGVACGTWVSPSIARTVKRVTLYLRSTVANNFVSAGWRYLQMSLRRASESPPASMLLGVAANDANAFYGGNLRGNSASFASYNFGTLSGVTPLLGTDRWLRVMWELDDNGPRVRFAAGATTGSTRPTLWTPINVDTQTQAASRTDLGSLGTSDAQIILGLESYGGSGGASTLTLSLTMEVES